MISVTSEKKWCTTDKVHLFSMRFFSDHILLAKKKICRHSLVCLRHGETDTLGKALTFSYRRKKHFSFGRATSIMTTHSTSTMLRLKQHLATTKRQKRYGTSSEQAIFRAFY